MMYVIETLNLLCGIYFVYLVTSLNKLKHKINKLIKENNELKEKLTDIIYCEHENSNFSWETGCLECVKCGYKEEAKKTNQIYTCNHDNCIMKNNGCLKCNECDSYLWNYENEDEKWRQMKIYDDDFDLVQDEW